MVWGRPLPASIPDAGPGLGSYLLVALVLALVLLPFLFVLLVPALQARGSGRSGWWLWLVGAFLPVANVALVVVWFSWSKRHPVRVAKRWSGSWEVVI